jgi:hypothetical protein
VNNTCAKDGTKAYLIYVQRSTGNPNWTISHCYITLNWAGLCNSRGTYSFGGVVCDVYHGDGLNWTYITTNQFKKQWDPSLCAVRRRACVIIATCPTAQFSASRALAGSPLSPTLTFAATESFSDSESVLHSRPFGDSHGFVGSTNFILSSRFRASRAVHGLSIFPDSEHAHGSSPLTAFLGLHGSLRFPASAVAPSLSLVPSAAFSVSRSATLSHVANGSHGVSPSRDL